MRWSGVLAFTALAGCADVPAVIDRSRDVEAARVLNRTIELEQRYGRNPLAMREVRMGSEIFDTKVATCGRVTDRSGRAQRAVLAGGTQVIDGTIGDDWYFAYLWQRFGC